MSAEQPADPVPAEEGAAAEEQPTTTEQPTLAGTQAQEGTVFDVDQELASKQEELNRRNQQASLGATAGFQSFRARTQALGAYLREKSVVVGDQVRSAGTTVGERLRNVDMSKARQTAAGAIGSVGQKVSTTGTQVWQHAKLTTQQAAEQMRKMGKTEQSLEAQCKAEALQRPVPRVVLCCCHFLCATGLKDEGLFTDPIQQDIVDSLMDIFQTGNYAVLFPMGTTPQIVSAFLKHYLATLPEPLLTYKLLPQFLGCVDNLEGCKDVLAQLPQPNFNALILVLDTCARVVAESETNGTSTEVLASALAPCLAWHPLPKAQTATPTGGVTPAGPAAEGETKEAEAEPVPAEAAEELRNLPLEPSELQRLEIVLSYLIQEFKGQQA